MRVQGGRSRTRNSSSCPERGQAGRDARAVGQLEQPGIEPGLGHLIPLAVIVLPCALHLFRVARRNETREQCAMGRMLGDPGHIGQDARHPWDKPSGRLRKEKLHVDRNVKGRAIEAEGGDGIGHVCFFFLLAFLSKHGRQDGEGYRTADLPDWFREQLPGGFQPGRCSDHRSGPL
jgi:hypothetical protein